MSKNTINILNRRATYEYHFIQKYVAGIVLWGTEVKSIREGNVNISDGYCFFKGDELFIRNIHIGQFKQGIQGTQPGHESLRIRKLLLKKTELRKLKSKSQDQGISIIPVKLFISETGYAKLEIALAQGKKSFDKREDIKKRDMEREIARIKIVMNPINIKFGTYMMLYKFYVNRVKNRNFCFFSHHSIRLYIQ